MEPWIKWPLITRQQDPIVVITLNYPKTTMGIKGLRKRHNDRAPTETSSLIFLTFDPISNCLHPVKYLHLPWTNTMIFKMLMSEIPTSQFHFQILIQGCPGNRLEGWMETRNTKKQYHDQLRNFVKVGEPSY